MTSLKDFLINLSYIIIMELADFTRGQLPKRNMPGINKKPYLCVIPKTEPNALVKSNGKVKPQTPILYAKLCFWNW